MSLVDLLIADMRARDALGAKRYNTRLQPFNGRDALVDAYQEALDLCAYLRQAIFEAEAGFVAAEAVDRTAEQPKPVAKHPDDWPAIWDLVITDVPVGGAVSIHKHRSEVQRIYMAAMQNVIEIRRTLFNRDGR